MKIRIVRQIRDDAAMRGSFLRLAQQVFGLSFEEWYQNGYWTDRYIPYAAVDSGRVAANASVNVMDFVRQGEPCRLVQIGTVMTDPAYRGRGLAGALLRRILSDWADACDGIYLFANSTVLDFYPRFGFARVQEFQHSVPLVPGEGISAAWICAGRRSERCSFGVMSARIRFPHWLLQETKNS